MQGPAAHEAPRTEAPRIDRVAGADAAMRELIERLLAVAQRGLGAMFRGDRDLFAHTLRRDDRGAIRLEGESFRYSAIVLLGARHLPESAQRAIFGGETAAEFCRRLTSRVGDLANLGDLALSAWAAAELDDPGLQRVVERLLAVSRAPAVGPTVELAWSLSALVTARFRCDVADTAAALRRRLLEAFAPEAGVFPHVLGASRRSSTRAHVACFADQVYPIQALARYHAAYDDAAALAAADRCAERICALQGPAGQWWWHYDARSGRVLEGYPVYSVHQDAMAPMALLDLAEAGGGDWSEALRRGLGWLERAPEVDEGLVDAPAQVIWRKVGRREPRKLVRSLRAAASWLQPDLRLDVLEALFPPDRIETECRPYHLGWLLDTWLVRP